MGSKIPRAEISSYSGEIQSLFYGFDMARMMHGLLAELIFGNMGTGIPTYARNDNAVYQVDSVNTATKEKRLNLFLESNREALEQNEWLGVGYIHGVINTSDGLAESISSVALRNWLSGNSPIIVTKERKRK